MEIRLLVERVCLAALAAGAHRAPKFGTTPLIWERQSLTRWLLLELLERQAQVLVAAMVGRVEVAPLVGMFLRLFRLHTAEAAGVAEAQRTIRVAAAVPD